MKELEDYSWFPPSIRNFQTEFIGYVVATFNIYDVFVNYLRGLHLQVQTMTDLCSGSGEPAISIFKKSNCFSRLVLSDKYPNAFELDQDKIMYEKLNGDVLEMKFKSQTCYTMFNAFHHFSDEDKRKIVHSLQDSGSQAFLVEILEPSVFCLFKVLFATIFGSLILTPFITPFSMKRLVFTYIIPVNVIAITIDGVISVFKSRSAKQYQKLFSDTDNGIQVFLLKNSLTRLTVIQIEPKK